MKGTGMIDLWSLGEKGTYKNGHITGWGDMDEGAATTASVVKTSLGTHIFGFLFCFC
jgi:hypothetical protein